ncbi:MAG: polysaccharide biosynthesis C-terminal domain-containing protein [Flavobacteriales bacterium]|nr:MAG: polysaccharide biosynthesis protein [Chlorobi bacterium OLB6]MBE2265754.1 polysaccharide biosynthesis C-terminal domain-containing protein [Flavobacteriales bacterium]MBW7854240.1 polysaccharide biosynthesis C-terminal domain-containing protein [Candidatus Kapabacteria bacterium]MCC6330641.1 polysaccharide biosynthesis C-terminal domain-containing protein [Ignavibacteria bacterium]MCL4276068.1 polysaccharide biosynthesis C-terminal domain-containing protein [Ignavibacteria bacterium]
MSSKLRSLASDTLVYGVSTVAGRFLTFLLTPLYTNYLTASEIGDVTAIYAAIAFIAVVYSLGLEPAYMRFFEQDNEQRSQSAFRAAFLGVALVGTLITIVTIVTAESVSASPFLQLGKGGSRLVQIAAFIPLLDALVLIPYARLRMMRQPGQFALMRLLGIVINVALNAYFLIWLDMHIEGVLWASVITNVLVFLVFVPSVSLKAAEPVWGIIKGMLRFGLPTVPASFSSIVVMVADRTVMLMLTSSATLGLYQTNFRLALPVMMFVTVFEYAFKPFYLQHRADDDVRLLLSRILTLFTAVCGLIFLVTALFMPYAVQLPFVGGKFINPLYWKGLVIIPVVMLAYYFNGVYINLAAGLHITMRTWWLPISTGVAAIVNVVAMLVLVPQMDIMGAAWAKVIAYAASVIVLSVYARRVYPVQYDYKKLVITLLTTGVVYGLAVIPELASITGIIARVAAVPVFILVLAAVGVIRKSLITSALALLPGRRNHGTKQHVR